MKKEMFNKILNTDFSELSYNDKLKSDVKCFYKGSNKNDKDNFRVYYFYDMNENLNKKISLELYFEFNDRENKVEMKFGTFGSKIKEQILVSLLSDKAINSIKNNVLNSLEFYIEYKTSMNTSLLKNVACLLYWD